MNSLDPLKAKVRGTLNPLDPKLTSRLISIDLATIDNLREMLSEQLSLSFVDQVRQIFQGHTVTLTSDSTAQVQSYVITYYKCTPVIITHWDDQVTKASSSWKFKARTCVDVQKNFELLGELQLKGQKSYKA